MNETLASLVIARRAHETRCCGKLMALRLRVPPAGCDLVGHATPLFEPRGVVAYAIFERTSDAMHFVDFDTGPGRSAQANEETHRPAVVGGKIKKGGILFAADHGGAPGYHSSLAHTGRQPLHARSASNDRIIRCCAQGQRAAPPISCRLFAEDRHPAHQAPLVRAEIGACMQRAPIVPNQEVAGTPDVLVDEFATLLMVE